MTTKHTPGPWTIDEVVDEPSRAGNYWVAHLNLGHERIEAPWPDATATVAPCLGLEGQPISREVVEANARLIAAAPDLLAALEAMVRSDSWADADVKMVNARAAIAKAKGGAA